MRVKLDPRLSLLVAVLLALPLAGHGAGECCNATTSLASGINDPTNGDEGFFKLSNGAANVMLLVDNSGSMAHLPPCGDATWGTNPAYGCGTLKIAGPAAPSDTSKAATIVSGTCLPATDTQKLCKDSKGNAISCDTAALAWMEAVTPQSTYADPGHGVQYASDNTTLLQDDRPPWSSGWSGADSTHKWCSGDSCLFDPSAYYLPEGWTMTSARRIAHDTDPTLAGACKLLDGSNNVVTDADGNEVVLGDACTQCMNSHGFFMFNVTYASGKAWNGSYQFKSSGAKTYFKGTFLNASPPKAVTARKIIKDLLWIDDSNPRKTDAVRLGLANFSSDSTGGNLPVGVGLVPTKANSYPVVKDNYKKARLPIVQWVNAHGSSFAQTATPIAHALLNVGQYFTDATVWSGWGFWTRTAFTNPGQSSDSCSVCWDCQKNSVVVVTDGSPNEDEYNWPTSLQTAGSADFTTFCGTNGVNCPDTNAGGIAMVPRVAYFLKNNAIHPSGGSGSNLNTYTVGINIPDGAPKNILRATGNMGTGTVDTGGWQNAYDPATLASMVYKAVEAASDKENSFSAPAVSAFQTSQTSTTQAFISRFMPTARNTWEGHLFAGKIFDEFVNGCDPTQDNAHQPQVECMPGVFVSANFNGNTDAKTGKALCGDVFLVDTDCKAIQEGGTTGEFYQLDLKDPSNPVVTSTPAKFPWDAGYLLSHTTMLDGTANSHFRAAGEPLNPDAKGDGTTASGDKARNIFTGVYDPSAGAWSKVGFTTANVATLQPFMSIEKTWCKGLLTDIGYSASSVPALPSTDAGQATECAKAIIYWVRGFDLFDADADGCGAPGMPTVKTPAPDFTTCKGEDRTRERSPTLWKLGDIFHSSPAVVRTPVPAAQCDLGYENQCVATIHSPATLPNQTPAAGGDPDPYHTYVLNHADRKQVVLVGANDGMLHAFDAGDADKTKTDPFGNYLYSSGTGEELWAFVPPDLLPKLWRLVKRNGTMSDHQYMVDGSTMVRDIWHDDDGDGKRSPTEFYTVAILTERSGGSQLTALDLTDTTNPRLLWAFPRPCSDDERWMAQSWSDFAPRPPPIGPVRIASKAARGFDELWIAMVNGGYDPAMGRGRAVFMVDAFTGETVWRFTDDDFKNANGYGSGTSMFPVAAAVGLVDLGDPTKPNFDIDGFFDTATWGDLGGNLFVARFHAPGTRDGTTKLVTNWYAARTFEEQRRDGDDNQLVGGRSEFFYMTSNAYEGTTRTLRTYLGSGNREQMLQKGPACGTDNLMGCCQAGCAVSSTSTDDYGACGFGNAFSCDASGVLTRGATTSPTACTGDAVCASGKNFASALNLTVTCPSATAQTVKGSVSIDASGVYASPSGTTSGFSPVGQQAFTGSLTTPAKSRFYGVWSYGGVAAKLFSSAADAKAFEKNRFTDATLASTTCSGPMNNTCTLVDTTSATVTYDTKTSAVTATCGKGVTVCQAHEYDAGWFYEYATDERTGSGATTVLACTAWNSLQPTGTAVGGNDICNGTTPTPATLGYLADYVSGTPTPACGYLDGTTVERSTPRNTTAPPSTSMVRATLNAKGQVQYSTLNLDPGAPPGSKTLGVRNEIMEPVYWLEVGRALHNCRHVNGGNCSE